MYRLTENETEYCLVIPFDDNERAKGIKGRRWDPTRKCWCFPKNKRSYDALVGEFGEDLVFQGVAPPGPLPKATVEELTPLLDARLAEIKSDLHQVIAGRDRERSTENLENEFRRALEEVQELRERLRASERKVMNQQAALTQMQGQLAAAQAEATRAAHQPATVNQLKASAIGVTGGDRAFKDLLDSLEIVDHLPIELAKHLENCLRLLVPTTKGDLFKLIEAAKDADKLSQPQYYLAHALRTQRNVLAHELVDPRTCMGRICVTLYAAALLWPELPEYP